MNAKGDVLVAWCQSVGANEAIYAAWRPDGGTFGEPFEVSPVGDLSFYPTVAMSPDGEAVIAWLSHESYGYEGQGSAEARLRSPSGELGRVVKLAKNYGEGVGITAAISDDGQATVVWLRHDAGGNNSIEAGSLASDGSFVEGTPVSPVSPHLTTQLPVIVTNAGGATAVVWQAAEADQFGKATSGYFTQVARGPGEDTFGSIVDVPIESEAVALEQDGDLVFAWSRAGVVETATLPAGGKEIEPPTVLTNLTARSENILDTDPVVSADAQGDGLITWISGTQPLAATFGESVGSSREIAKPNAVASDLVNSMNARGDSVTMWVGAGGNHEGVPVVESVARPASGGFGPTRQLATTGSVITPPQLALDADGDATAAWMSSNGTHDSVQIAGYQAGGPRLENLQTPAEGQAGVSLTVSVEPLSVWSTVKSTTWSWGDGTANTVGNSVSHTYNQPGVYTISVSVLDELGNSTTTASRTITVREAGTNRQGLEPPPRTQTTHSPNQPLRAAPRFEPLFGTKVASSGEVLGLLVKIAAVRGAATGDTLTVRCVAGCVRPFMQTVHIGNHEKAPGKVVLTRPLVVHRATRIEIDLYARDRITRFVRYRFARDPGGLIGHVTRRGCLSATGKQEKCPLSS